MLLLLLRNIWTFFSRVPTNSEECSSTVNRINRSTTLDVIGCHSHRIHDAGIYANIWGILMGSMLPYIYIYISTMDPSWDWIGYEHWQEAPNQCDVESPWFQHVNHQSVACYCRWSHLPNPGFEDLLWWSCGKQKKTICTIRNHPQNYHRWLVHGGINHINCPGPW